MFVTNWISTTKIQKISEITNFFRHYFLSRTEVWLNFNKTDKYVMVSICEGNNPAQDRNQPTSTMTSALLRLSKKGYIFRSDRYEIEDPFFRKWILKNMIE